MVKRKHGLGPFLLQNQKWLKLVSSLHEIKNSISKNVTQLDFNFVFCEMYVWSIVRFKFITMKFLLAFGAKQKWCKTY